MRLLDTTTKQLTEFQSDIPVYAILSHVWGKEEVTFQDITDLNKAKKMQGFAKIIGACDTAIKGGFKYLWIDTCCINKESSAELSEAINSMYAWYKGARICYAYLSDVPSEGDHQDICSLFAMSKWFSRGWTLQELIAPLRVVFYGADWVDIGTKATLQETISAVTGISTDAISGDDAFLDDVPVAVRMSWAANRNTTREEDRAYSLMGLFGVNMPLLYGEGTKAFTRLQHEIIKKSTDHSIFAWTTEGPSTSARGMLARSPREFRNSGRVQTPAKAYDRQRSSSLKPYSITNRGLQIELPLVIVSKGEYRKTWVLLDCYFSGESEPVAIQIKEPISPMSCDYIRWADRVLQFGIATGWVVERPPTKHSLCIADDHFTSYGNPQGGATVLLKVKGPAGYGALQCTESKPDQHWEEIVKNEWKFTNPTFNAGKGGVLKLSGPRAGDRFAVIVGLREPEAVLWCDVLTDLKDEDGQSITDSYKHPAYGGTRKQRFLDRSSADLPDGWSITISSGTSNVTSTSGEEFVLHAEVNIIKSPLQTHLPPVKRPDGKMGYLVFPPQPQHGFAVDTNNIQLNSPNASWIQRLDSFILYTSASEVEVLPFKSRNSKEVFFFLLGRPVPRKANPAPRDINRILSGIEKTRPDDPTRSLRAQGAGGGRETYSRIIGQGKSVFVTIQRCGDISVADFIIKISM